MGSVGIAIVPTRVMRIEQTIAKTGRAKKKSITATPYAKIR